jgi:glucan biosynthesis protein C
VETHIEKEGSSAVRKKRLVYLDNIKAALILLVVAHHAGQAYGPTDYWPIRSPEQASILGPFFDVNGAFFMGLFFFISAYFLPASVDRKGIAAALKSRCLRLGIPLILMTIGIFGPFSYFVDNQGMPFWQYLFAVYIGQGDFEVAHLWFLALLLFFIVCYGILRFLAGLAKTSIAVKPQPPGHLKLLLLVVLLCLANYMVRIWFPVGRWVDVLPFMPVEIGRLPQYVLFFILGIFAYRGNWLNEITSKTGFTWLSIGIAAAALHYINTFTSFIPESPDVWLLLESFIGVGLCVGIVVIGRERWNDRGKVLAFMADNAFTVYLVHIIFIFLLQVLAEDVAMVPFLKFAVVALAGMILSFTVSHLIRKIPYIRSIL